MEHDPINALSDDRTPEEIAAGMPSPSEIRDKLKNFQEKKRANGYDGVILNNIPKPERPSQSVKPWIKRVTKLVQTESATQTKTQAVEVEEEIQHPPTPAPSLPSERITLGAAFDAIMEADDEDIAAEIESCETEIDTLREAILEYQERIQIMRKLRGLETSEVPPDKNVESFPSLAVNDEGFISWTDANDRFLKIRELLRQRGPMRMAEIARTFRVSASGDFYKMKSKKEWFRQLEDARWEAVT